MKSRSAHEEDRKKEARTLKEKRAAKKAKHASNTTSMIPPIGS